MRCEESSCRGQARAEQDDSQRERQREHRDRSERIGRSLREEERKDECPRAVACGPQPDCCGAHASRSRWRDCASVRCASGGGSGLVRCAVDLWDERWVVWASWAVAWDERPAASRCSGALVGLWHRTCESFTRREAPLDLDARVHAGETRACSQELQTFFNTTHQHARCSKHHYRILNDPRLTRGEHTSTLHVSTLTVTAEPFATCTHEFACSSMLRLRTRPRARGARPPQCGSLQRPRAARPRG